MERGSYWMYGAHRVIFFGQSDASPFVSVFPVWRVDGGDAFFIVYYEEHLCDVS